MRQVNIHAAKTNLSRLLDDVERGEDVVIARAGRPIARLIPFRATRAARIPGLLRGQLWVADDFDAHDEELIRLFEGADDPG